MTDEKGWTVPSAGTAFPFDTPGAWCKIKVEEFEPNIPVTDMKTGELKQYKSGGQIYMHRIGGTILESSDAAWPAGTAASVYMSGAMKPTGDDANGPYGARNAVISAAIKRATGGNQLMPGSELTTQYIGDEPDTPRGQSPTKRYQAWYAYVAAPLGAVGPTSPATQVASPVQSVSTPATAGVAAATGAPTTPTASAAPTGPPGLTPEQEAEAALAAWQATQEPAAEAWESDPRVAPLRAKNLPDATIRSILKI